eukprot:4787369-Prymnesium_polylepis.1
MQVAFSARTTSVPSHPNMAARPPQYGSSPSHPNMAARPPYRAWPQNRSPGVFFKSPEVGQHI